MLAYVYGRSGQPVQARRALEKLDELSRREQIDPAPMLVAQVGMNNKDAAFSWLQEDYLQQFPCPHRP